MKWIILKSFFYLALGLVGSMMPREAPAQLAATGDHSADRALGLNQLAATVSKEIEITIVPATPRVRRSIATLDPAGPEIASLRRGIEVMMSRHVDMPTSYRFQANIHGTHDSPDPNNSIEAQAWNKCQHGSYYFFSWHRMYLYFFERILRAASGDANLALPYWNWSDPSQRSLPIAFRQPSDSNSNPLYIAFPGRPQSLNNGAAALTDATVSFTDAFGYTNFMSVLHSGLSFGGQQVASPMQFNGPHGELENQPHDVVHVALGGWMTDPDMAARDPIFWLHHANIDRLWKRWLDEGGGRQDPLTDSNWMNTTFHFFDENGNAVPMTGSQIINTAKQLGYVYDDDPPTTTAELPSAPPVAAAPEIVHRVQLAAVVPENRIQLSNAPTTVSVPLSQISSDQLNAILAPNSGHKLVLELQDIQYEKPSGVYYEVYIDLAQSEKPDIHSVNYLGTLALFGLMPHPMHGSAVQPTQGGIRDYEVTKIVRELMTQNLWHGREMSVTFVPRGPVGVNGEQLPIPPGIVGTFGKITLSAE